MRDQAPHITAHEQIFLTERNEPRLYLEKNLISVHEKPVAMRDLGLMGISAMTLFPSIEGVCRHLANALFPSPRLGLTPTQRTEAFLESLGRLQAERQSTGAAPLLGPFGSGTLAQQADASDPDD